MTSGELRHSYPPLSPRKKKMQPRFPNPRNNELSSVSSPSPLDELYCEEERWENEGDGEVLNSDDSNGVAGGTGGEGCSLSPILLLEHDLLREDEELGSLYAKEQSDGERWKGAMDVNGGGARRRAVEWMVNASTHYGFSTLTAVLAINYLDRFMSTPCYREDKPWMVQLVAVTCLSLAAKVEETDVPLLLDLQVEETRYLFEAKTIQRMELLVLSALQWKMHPVTAISFVDHIVRKLGLEREFLSRCHSLLLRLVSDSRSVRFKASVLATATMMHVIDQVEHFNNNSIDYQTQLLTVLNITKDLEQEKVEECYEVVMEVAKGSNGGGGKKRKYYCQYDGEEGLFPSSPSGVIDGEAFLSSDSTSDSWKLGRRMLKGKVKGSFPSLSSSSSSSSSVCSSPPPPPLEEAEQQQPVVKKSRNQDDDQWVFVGFVESPN